MHIIRLVSKVLEVSAVWYNGWYVVICYVSPCGMRHTPCYTLYLHVNPNLDYLKVLCLHLFQWFSVQTRVSQSRTRFHLIRLLSLASNESWICIKNYCEDDQNKLIKELLQQTFEKTLHAQDAQSLVSGIVSLLKNQFELTISIYLLYASSTARTYLKLSVMYWHFYAFEPRVYVIWYMSKFRS